MQLTRALPWILLTAAASFAQTVDLGLFGGSQHWFGNRKGGELVPGGVFGVRGGAELDKHWALEGAWTYGVNNLRAFPQQAVGVVRPRDVGFGARNHHLSLNPVWHFTESGQRWRPYLTAGLGALSFRPTDSARRLGLATQPELAAAALKSDLLPAFNWGGGVKYLLRDAFHLRVDLRHIVTGQPHFGLSRTPVIPGATFMEKGGRVNGLQATLGLGFQVGRSGLVSGGSGGAASAAGAARAASGSGRTLDVDVTASSKNVASNGRTTLRASVKDPAPAAADLTYRWTVNGQGTDVTGPDFLFNAGGRQPGDYNICVSAMSSAPGWRPGSECYTVTVTALPAPTVKVTSPLTIEPGSTATLTATGEVANSAPIEYQWTVAGQNIASNAATYNFGTDGRQPGLYPVCVTATANGLSSDQACTSVTIRECTAPKLTLGAPGAEIFAGDRANVTATAQPGSCGSPVRISFRAGDGTITGDAKGNTATGVLDSTNVAFDRANRSKLQRKNVVVTATATDEKGQTATAQTTVVVKLAPEAQRLDDVLFASGSARVNNCGKRVLLEMLAPRLRDDPEARVLLIGHVDAAEGGRPARAKKKGKRAAAAPAALDRARVLNAAAVISAGAGICPTLELSRVKVSYAGKTQTSEVRPLFCGSSTERRATKGARARADQRAPFRRVEVWIVPNGAPLPQGVQVQDAPEREVKALSCPK